MGKNDDGKKKYGNKKPLSALVSKQTFETLKAIHEQMLYESGGPSWNRFLESVLTQGIVGSQLYREYHHRYMERAKEATERERGLQGLRELDVADPIKEPMKRKDAGKW